MRTLSSTELALLDNHIFQKEILRGIQLLRNTLGLDLRGAQEEFTKRYEELRRSHGDRFTLSETEYWEGFYS